MKRLNMPKSAVILSALVSFAWIVLFYATPWSPAHGPRAALVMAIPVALSLWGFSSERFRRMAGIALLVFTFVICVVSFWIIGLSYLPSAILLFLSKRAEASTPAPIAST
ncbi:MAG TPA: hypothetical protein VK686_00175 [Bryobacteraceae bacterium]|jgi:hypothetical protein|nr:hypothetical protein [Bryobacteraceae bacterium]